MSTKNKTHVAEVVDVDVKERTVKAIITTDGVDSDKEVVLTSGLKFDRFQKNPVVLWMHQADVPIGKSLWQKVGKRQVMAKTQFATTAVAQEVFKLFEEGILKGWSIGMDPSSMKIRDMEEGDVRKRKEWIGAKRMIESADIVEYSAVSVPANPDALNRAYGKGLINLTASQFSRPEPVRIETVNVRAVEVIRIEAPEVKAKTYTESEAGAYIKRRLDFVRGLT